MYCFFKNFAYVWLRWYRSIIITLLFIIFFVNGNDIFTRSWKILLQKDKIKMCAKVIESSFLLGFKMLFGMPFRLFPLLDFMVAKLSVISSAVTGVRKSKSFFASPLNEKWVVSVLTIFQLNFPAILVKHLLKCLAICLSLVVTVLLIIKLVKENVFLLLILMISLIIFQTFFRFFFLRNSFYNWSLSCFAIRLQHCFIIICLVVHRLLLCFDLFCYRIFLFSLFLVRIEFANAGVIQVFFSRDIFCHVLVYLAMH